MTLGANNSRDELVRTLRGMKYTDLDLSFYEGKDTEGNQREGYDRYGKYHLRIGWGIGVILSFLFAFITFDSFIPLGRGSDARYYDDAPVWLRQNSYWTIPIWAIATYFLWKADKKVERKDLEILAPLMKKNGLKVLPKGTRFPGDLSGAPNYIGTLEKSAFAVSGPGKTEIAFGLSHLWWDESSKREAASINSGLLINGKGRLQTLFVHVSVPQLSSEIVYLNPKNPPDWNQLPSMNQKAKEALTKLASGYAVVVGGGGLGVAQTLRKLDDIDNSWRSNASVRSVLETSYKLLSTDIANVVEGLE
jgi:hypothetical protein